MYLFVVFAFLLMRFGIWVFNDLKLPSFTWNFFSRRVRNINSLFVSNFIDPRVLFATKFKALANISLIKNINASDAYELVVKNFGNEITAIYQFNTFDHTEKKALFNVTIFVLKNKRIIELGYDYAEILYTGKDYDWANNLLNRLSDFKVTERTKVMGFANSEVMN